MLKNSLATIELPSQVRTELFFGLLSIAHAPRTKDKPRLRIQSYIVPVATIIQVGIAIPAASLGALSILCHAGGTVIGGGDGTVTLFDNSGKDYGQTELQGGVVTMSFSADRTEVC